MVVMTLKMIVATMLYVATTAFLWHFWSKKADHTKWEKVGVGLLYGLLSVISSHVGIDYENAVMNVRDLGPLAAGLFFDPLSGILSGLIGGIERYAIGEFFGIGYFTRAACGISTCAAGLLAAVLHRWVYNGKRPPVVHAFALGAEMEVFHMYIVFLTHRDELAEAYDIVKGIAFTMILFTGMGLLLCSAVIFFLSGGKLTFFAGKHHRKHTPIDVLCQRWLLAVTAVLFALSFAMTYGVQGELALENARLKMDASQRRYTRAYRNSNPEDPQVLQTILDDLRQASIYSDTLNELIDTKKGLFRSSAMSDAPEDNVEAPRELVAAAAANAGKDSFTAGLNGGEFLCISTRLNSRYCILVMMGMNDVYLVRDIERYETTFIEILIFTALYLLVSILLDKMVVKNLRQVNESLGRITAGDLGETVAVESSLEFTELSRDINRTVAVLRGYILAAERRMAEDLKLAAEIQDAALPKNFRLPTSKVELYALMTPAKGVGGDFYDFFFIEEGSLCLVIADVSGKSVPGAMFMMRAKTAIKHAARRGMGPEELLSNVNSVLCEGNEAQMFVTVWLGILNLRSGRMRCANAGHEYPVVMHSGGDYELMHDPHGMSLAAMETVRVKEYEILMKPGDRLFVYTDGVPEAMNEQEQFYGKERMVECLNQLKDQSQEQVLTGMLRDIRSFACAAEQFDDITMLGLTYLG